MKIEEILKDEEVERKKLGDLIDYVQPTKYIVKSTNYSNKYNTPVLTAGDTFILGYTDEIKGIYKASTENPVIIFDDFTTSNHWVDFNFKVKSSAMKILKPKNKDVNFRYCYHYMQTIKFNIVEHRRIWISKYSQVKIPLPSMEAQEKIVNILDKFDKYSTELQAELQFRTSQYEYYRDLLLSEDYLKKLYKKICSSDLNKDMKLEKISSLCFRQKGIKITAKEMKELDNSHNPIKIFAGGETHAYLSEKEVGKKNILTKPSVIVKSRGNIDFEYYDKPFSHKNEMWSYSSKDCNKLNIKFLYYYLSNNLQYFKDKAIAGKLPQISTKVTDNYKVPLIDIRVQDYIVEKLDKFSNLIEETQGLLPKEIDLRQKQYQYYRDRLLDFREDKDD